MLEAYKAAVPSGDKAYIYEFRGRYLKPANAQDETGQPILQRKCHNMRSVYVMAESLCDAVLYLTTHRANFSPREAILRGIVKIESRDRKDAMKRLTWLRRRAEEQAAKDS